MAKPSEKYDRQIEELAALFGTVSAGIATAIAAAAREGTPATLDALRAYIEVRLGLLLSAAVLWINQTVPTVYRDGVGDALGALEGEAREPGERGVPAPPVPSEGERGIPAPPGRAELERPEHIEAIAGAQRELASALQNAVNGIGVTANARLEDIRRANIARALAQGAPLANALDQRVAADMARADITFRDRAGREWQAETYARMVLRTHVASILNVGHVNAAIELGSSYVRVFDGGPGTVDEPCKRANGQVWHIAVAATNLLEHPNCRRSFAALDPSYSGPVDRDIERVAA